MPTQKIGFFGLQNSAVPLEQREKNYFFSTLNLMILQIVWNECVRFGRHVNIQVSYKILWLEVPKLVLILHYSACFQKELFGGNFEQKTPLVLSGLIVDFLVSKQ
jgi:hypothetical protein